MITYIYSLIDPETQEVRYVGKSNTPGKRLVAHVCTTHDDCNPHKQNWIKQLKSRGLRPILSIIEETTLDLWPEREIYWIEFYRSMGSNLTNLAGGGLGGGLASEETKLLISKKTSIRMKDQSVRDHLRDIFGRKIVRSDGEEFGSIRFLAEQLDIEQHTLRKYIDSGEEVNGFIYYWLNNTPKRPRHNASKIRCVETGIEYDSIMAASLAYKTSRNCIRESLNLGLKVKTHTFEYVDKSKVNLATQPKTFICVETGEHMSMDDIVSKSKLSARNVHIHIRLGYRLKGFHYKRITDT